MTKTKRLSRDVRHTRDGDDQDDEPSRKGQERFLVVCVCVCVCVCMIDGDDSITFDKRTSEIHLKKKNVIKGKKKRKKKL